ncbi:hypothetical protein HELRODRAFT_181272 [Helobdella robusta]|uniref:Uncharacterized protein n=1 Tax=Helobdella robusta TaxID=6412 RepID=T1FGT9_HELRO|nr:hypothetical protein HELRODRAFT_181272 [Helobdella robusta]ESN93163.1 hypothetical protein HELRODRAFT_181272 [Helobdella robusta]
MLNSVSNVPERNRLRSTKHGDLVCALFKTSHFGARSERRDDRNFSTLCRKLSIDRIECPSRQNALIPMWFVMEDVRNRQCRLPTTKIDIFNKVCYSGKPSGVLSKIARNATYTALSERRECKRVLKQMSCSP